MDIVEAALKWRKGWVDFEDELEMKNGCTCEVCQLIRACDEEIFTTLCYKCGKKLINGWCDNCQPSHSNSASKNVEGKE
jgi:hypothetical protein